MKSALKTRWPHCMMLPSMGITAVTCLDRGQDREDVCDHTVASRSVKWKGFGSRDSGPSIKLLPEHAVRPVEPNLDIVFRERKAVGSLRGRHLLYVAQHHDCPVLLGQAFDRLFENCAHFESSGFGFRVGSQWSRCNLVLLVLIHGVPILKAFCFVQASQRLMHRNPGQ